MSWCVYSNIACGLNMSRAWKSTEDVFGLVIPPDKVYKWKTHIAVLYESLYSEILQSVLASPVIHIDETTVRIRDRRGYVWVMTTMDKVYYFYKPSREGSFLQEMLRQFSGTLVSDFYTAYDSLPCKQQKCLLHLIRDIDDDVLRNPLDAELKGIAEQFGTLLRTIIETIDCYGLKSRHLRKHGRAALRFLDSVSSSDFSSELATKYQKRFQESGEKSRCTRSFSSASTDSRNSASLRAVTGNR